MRGIKTSRDGKYRMTYADQALKKKTCCKLARYVVDLLLTLHINLNNFYDFLFSLSSTKLVKVNNLHVTLKSYIYWTFRIASVFKNYSTIQTVKSLAVFKWNFTLLRLIYLYNYLMELKNDHVQVMKITS